MSSLTVEQRKMIEEKKKAAQAKLAAKLNQSIIPMPSVTTKHNSNQCVLLKSGSVISPSPNGKTIRINYNSSSKSMKCSPVQGTCELTSRDRFTVNVGYHQQLVETFKTISSKNYGKYYWKHLTKKEIIFRSFIKYFIFLDPQTSKWSFHIKDYDQFILSIKSLEPDVKIEKLPQYILKVSSSANSWK